MISLIVIGKRAKLHHQQAMGKKNRKAKAVVTTADGDMGMPRSVRRECLEIVNMLLDSKYCKVP